jgi:hypothetical protein
VSAELSVLVLVLVVVAAVVLLGVLVVCGK